MRWRGDGGGRRSPGASTNAEPKPWSAEGGSVKVDYHARPPDQTRLIQRCNMYRSDRRYVKRTSPTGSASAGDCHHRHPEGFPALCCLGPLDQLLCRGPPYRPFSAAARSGPLLISGCGLSCQRKLRNVHPMRSRVGGGDFAATQLRVPKSGCSGRFGSRRSEPVIRRGRGLCRM